jgi:hypothetical protein
MEIPQPSDSIPPILLAINKEKFNRRVRVFSLVLGYLLIFVMVYAGYMQWKQSHDVGTNYCYACGYYNAKQCVTAYFTDAQLKANTSEELRRQLGVMNAKDDPLVKSIGYVVPLGEQPELMNLTNIPINPNVSRLDSSALF